MVDRTNLYRIAPFAAYVFFMILEDVLLKFGWEANDLRWLYAVKITAVVALLWVMRSAYSELRWPSAAGFRTWGAAIIAGIVVFVAWINMTADWMVMGESVGFDPRNEDEIELEGASAAATHHSSHCTRERPGSGTPDAGCYPR